MEKKPSKKKSDGLLDNPFYNSLFKKFDKGLQSQLDSFKRTISVKLNNMDLKLEKCEASMYALIKKKEQTFEKDLALAETLVNKELRSKVIMSQWTNKFLSSEEQSVIDPITFAISRFALNICISYIDIQPSYLIESKIPLTLIHFIGLPYNLIIGPCLMALVHISLHSEMKSLLVANHLLVPLLKLMSNNKSKVILALCCKLCASLALEPTNKPFLTQSGCFHAFFDLILGNHVQVDSMIQYYTLCAIENTLSFNDSNRLLVIELHGIKPLLTLIQTTFHFSLLLHAIRILGNIAYHQNFTTNAMLLAGCGDVLITTMNACDILTQPHIIHASLSTLANMCYSEANQTHVGNIEGLLDTVIRIVQYVKEIFLLTECGNFIVAASWQNNVNKSRVANKGGCIVLVKRIIELTSRITLFEKQSQKPPDEGGEDSINSLLLCIERLSFALSSILLYTTNHERMIATGGLEEMIRLCKITSHPMILRSLGKIITTMVPSPDDILRFHKDSSRHIIEKLNTLQVLKKIELLGFAEVANPPDWLTLPISILSMNDEELLIASSTTMKKEEFINKSDYCKEFCIEIKPDTTVYESKDFHGLLFSIY